jgi:uncharacterized protein (TIGR04255 family)
MSTNTNTERGYARPPVVEAVVGITFTDPVTDAALATVDRRFGKHYPVHQPADNISFVLDAVIQNGKSISHNAQKSVVHGHRRSTVEMDEVSTLQPNAIAVAQLAPYKGWDAFIARVERDLGLYRRSTKFREIQRIGVRYINRIDLPAEGNVIEQEKYLNVYPQVPDGLGPMLSYSMEASFSLDDIGCVATLRTMPMPSPTLGHASFVIDLDVFAANNLPQSDAAVMSLLNNIRTEKNRIFELSVKQLARDNIFGYVDR